MRLPVAPDRHERPAARVNVGGASLIMIFAILCLTVFAALSLSTALAERATIQRYADTTSQYYAADARAIGISRIVSSDYSAGYSDDAIVQDAAQSGGLLTVTGQGAGKRYSYSVPLNDAGSIIAVTMQPAAGGSLAVVSYTQQETSAWQADDRLQMLFE